MGEHDPFLAERLREADVPPFDAPGVISAATARGRRTVRRRRGVGALVALSAVAAVGAGAALAYPHLAPDSDSGETLVADATTDLPAAASAPAPTLPDGPVGTPAIPRVGAEIPEIVQAVTHRTVTWGPQKEPEIPYAQFQLDGYWAAAAFGWGPQNAYAPDARMGGKAVLPPEGSTLERCRAELAQTALNGYTTCTLRDDGSTVLLGGRNDTGTPWQEATVYRTDGWTHGATVFAEDAQEKRLDEAGLPSAEELLALLDEGDWLQD